MVYMFITRIAMAEGSNVKIGLHTSEVRESQEMGLKYVPVNPFDLKRTPDYKRCRVVDIYTLV